MHFYPISSDRTYVLFTPGYTSALSDCPLLRCANAGMDLRVEVDAIISNIKSYVHPSSPTRWISSYAPHVFILVFLKIIKKNWFSGSDTKR